MAHATVAAEAVEAKAFPTTGIVPKKETGAAAFLEANPAFDGRGVVVAVLDTGVDVGAPGLQTTPDGRPKIIDTVECSGSGDVDVSTVRKAGADGTVEGLAGRPLKPAPGWTNPSGEWRVGVKRALELYPRALEKRMVAEWTKKWKEKHAHLEAEARRALAAFDDAHPGGVSAATDPAAAAERADLQDRVDALKSRMGAFKPSGPVYDCLVWHDGSVWRAAVDTTETGDFKDAVAMTNFRAERQWSTLGDRDLLNYAVNIYNDEDVLSIVTDAGAHGTHVSGIVAAYHEGEPAHNGVAPGAQIVAVKIGDSRLGSMETAVGLSRGLRAVVENRCDLINMSYGEPAAVANYGKFISMATDVVNKHGIIFIGSAGNNGPALTTVGAPGGTSSALLGIGAMVTPAMMRASYSMHKQVPSVSYTWSSRGPTMDGALGVCVSAPGGAVTSVPNWTLQKNQLMNGTSMSSPNACGCVALVLSGLKASGVAYTPHSIRRSLECTAEPIAGSDVFGLGHGLVQVGAAYEHAVRTASGPVVAAGAPVRKPYPRLVVTTNPGGGRGIYLRQPAESAIAREYSATISAEFHEDGDQRDKVDLDIRMTLVSTAPWVSVPDHLLFNAGGRGFTFHVDPTRLGSGAHYAEIRGYDSEDASSGPVIRVPVTVMRPLPGDAFMDFGTLESIPGKIHRFMVAVPRGAAWADVTLKRVDGGTPITTGTLSDAAAGAGAGAAGGGDDGDRDGAAAAAATSSGAPDDTVDKGSRMVVVHAMQILPHTSPRETEKEVYLRLMPGESSCVSFPVTPGVTVEVVVAQYWAAMGGCSLETTVGFHGLSPSSRELSLHSSVSVSRVDVESLLETTTLAPDAKLTHWRQALTPSKATVRPLASRDAHAATGAPSYEAVLSYSFTQSAPGAVKPFAPHLNNALYESVWGAQLMLFADSNKQLVGTSDAFAESISLGKGDYTLRVQVRHENAALLEGLSKMPVLLERKLSKEVKVPAYANVGDAVTKGRAFPATKLLVGSSVPVFFAAPGAESLPDGPQPGDQLKGTVTYAKFGDGIAGAGKRPGGFPLTMAVGPVAKGDGAGGNGGSASGPKDERTPEQKAADELRDARVEMLGKLKGDTHKAELAKLLVEYPKHTPLLSKALEVGDSSWTSASAADRDAVARKGGLADAVLDSVDADSVAVALGVKAAVDEDPTSAEVGRRRDAEKGRDAIVDALHRKARALMSLTALRDGDSDSSGSGGAAAASGGGSAVSGSGSGSGSGDGAAMLDAYRQLSKWTDVSKPPYSLLGIEAALARGHRGTALKGVDALLASGDTAAGKVAPVPKLRALRRRLLTELEFGMWVEHEDVWDVLKRPKDWPLF